MAGKRDGYQLEKRCFRKNGEMIWVQITAALERDADGAPTFAISMFENITERKLAQETLRRQAELNEHQALHDALTGLANRRKLYLDVEARLAAASPFVLAIFDLDGFKAYNDTFGHPAGDALLARLGAKLADIAVAGRATAYRMGGDEFCVVGDGHLEPTRIEDARAALCEQGEAFTIGCSRGAAHVPTEASTLERALHLADERLYVDKRVDEDRRQPPGARRAAPARRRAERRARDVMQRRSPGSPRRPRSVSASRPGRSPGRASPPSCTTSARRPSRRRS